MILKKLKDFNRKISLKLDAHTFEIFEKSVASMIVKILGMIGSISISIYLGRTLGADGLGVITLSFKIITIILVFSLFGFPKFLIKEIAIAFRKKRWERIGNLMNSAYLINGSFSLVISIIFILVTPYISIHFFNEPRLITPLTVALVAMTPMVFSRLFSSALIGYRKIWQSNLVNETLRVYLVGIILIVMYLADYEITVIKVVYAYAFAQSIVTISIGIYWHKLYSSTSISGVKKKIQASILLKKTSPFLLIATTVTLASNIDIIMLGWLKDTSQVGLYTVAGRIAFLSSFLLLITNSAVSSKIAALYAENKIQQLELMVQRVTAGLSVLGLIPLLIFIVFGSEILTIWGVEFAQSYWILIYLGIGQFVNMSTGAVGLILSMCGYESKLWKLSAIFLILSIILNYIFINLYGGIGAAIATSIVIISKNILYSFIVYRELNIYIFPILAKFK